MRTKVLGETPSLLSLVVGWFFRVPGVRKSETWGSLDLLCGKDGRDQRTYSQTGVDYYQED